MPDDEYTEAPTHLRIFSDGREWFLDGADNDLNYTEACWSYDSFEEAVAAMPEFVKALENDDYGIKIKWDAQRTDKARSLSALRYEAKHNKA